MTPMTALTTVCPAPFDASIIAIWTAVGGFALGLGAGLSLAVGPDIVEFVQRWRYPRQFAVRRYEDAEQQLHYIKELNETTAAAILGNYESRQRFTRTQRLWQRHEDVLKGFGMLLGIFLAIVAVAVVAELVAPHMVR